jgi:hypothetical protein
MKTAVEWLESEMLEHYSPFDNIILYTAIHKAIEMEKEQRKKCFFDGKLMCINNKDISFEDYELGNFNNPRVHFATKQQEQ